MSFRKIALSLVPLLLWCCSAIAQNGYSAGTTQSFVDTTTSICNTAQQNVNCWQSVAGSPALSQISVGGDGIVIAIKTDGTLTKYNPSTQSWGSVPALAGVFSISAVDKSNIYALAPTTGSPGKVRKYTNGVWDMNPLPAQPATFTQVAAGVDGDLWALGEAYGCGRHVYHFNPSTSHWDAFAQGLTDISVTKSSVVLGVCTGIAWPNDNIFYYKNGAWSSLNGWLSQISQTTEGNLWGLGLASDPTWYRALNNPSFTSLSGRPSFIDARTNLSVFGLFSNQLEQFQAFTIQVSHTVSGTYSSNCGMGMNCLNSQHVAISRLQISGHALITGVDHQVWNQNLYAVASDTLTPTEAFDCMFGSVCSSVTTGGDPTATGAGVSCSSMGVLFSDWGEPFHIKIEFAITRTIKAAGQPWGCKTSVWSDVVMCWVPTRDWCSPETSPPDMSIIEVWTQNSPPPVPSAWDSIGECNSFETTIGWSPWQCTPAADMPIAYNNNLPAMTGKCTKNPLP